MLAYKKDFCSVCQVCDACLMGKKQKSHMPRPSLYGFHAVREAWLNDERRIEALLITKQATSGFEQTLVEAERAGIHRPAPMIVDKDTLEKALPRGAVHQGLGLACSDLPEKDIQDLIIANEHEDRVCLVILDQVTDPHNVGAILRSACAFGAKGMIMQKKHAPEMTGALSKAACGALEHVPVAFETNLSRSIEALQEAGYFVYGLDERGEEVQTVDFSAKNALVLGAEGPGMRRLVKDHCDVLVRLPMHGPMPSINVSNAAAVALHEIAKT